jgi:DNA repair protein RecN (Recombination protein N)
MLKAITARDFAVLDAVELDLSAGLTALTGETGAGKSILIDALMLCLGGRASTDWIRANQDKLDVTATFDVTHNSLALAWLDAQELSVAESEADVQLRRVISRDGRSKAFINGSAQPLAHLRELGALLCEIHGQQEFLSLMNADAQRAIIDNLGVDADTIHRVKTHAQALAELERKITELTQAAADRDARLAWLLHQVKQLNEFNPQPAEESQLRQEVQRMSHHRKLIDGMSQAQAVLSEGDGMDVLALLAKAQHALRGLTELDARLGGVHTLLQEAVIQVREGTGTLADIISRAELDPAVLELKTERLAQYEQLARKYRVEANELVSVQAQLNQEYQQLNSADAALAQWQQERERQHQQYLAAAASLSQQRQRIAQDLSARMTRLVSQLGMPAGRIEVSVTYDPTRPPRASGQDSVEFLVSANAGMPLKPVAKIASGGELSRISLAIQVAAKHTKQSQWAMVFDEVDAGVGGAVAEMVGRELKQLSRSTQVLCVTHLPQVAAQADQHILVVKSQDKTSTRTQLKPLSEAERVTEIARMLAGVTVTASARSHAAQLLKDARVEPVPLGSDAKPPKPKKNLKR